MNSTTHYQPHDHDHDHGNENENENEHQPATQMSRQLEALRTQLASMKRNDPMYLQQKKKLLDLEVRFEQLQTQTEIGNAKNILEENREKPHYQNQKQHQKQSPMQTKPLKEHVDTPVFLFVPQQSLAHKKMGIPQDSFNRNESTESVDIASAIPDNEPSSIRSETVAHRSNNPTLIAISSPRGSGSQPRDQALLQERLKRLQVVLEEQEEEGTTADRLN
eukprot:CAMPEP_0184693176 /NCGR_PEP_ID=MMETSP0313-20130426/1460_1 /TAXON_ID=2792 /ORGANISM="Porphyridium aerugineum, Strain SAG 1380-2" /LENGTH=219 /DNA_ID=CAMNT_0027151175 /DNA_START=551 /DNA_END=1210 /DNA_ORIENTATION=+